MKLEQNKDHLDKYLNETYEVYHEKYSFCDQDSTIEELYSIKLIWDNNSSDFTIKNFDNKDNDIEARISRIMRSGLIFRTVDDSGFASHHEGEINEEMGIYFRHHINTKNCEVNFNIRSKESSNPFPWIRSEY